MPAFHVSRSIQIEAASERVFETVRDFSTWKSWSPWLLADKEAEFVIDGDPQAVGGGYHWSGTVVGAGQMKHVSIDPPDGSRSGGLLRMDLQFLRPWKSQAKVEFDINKVRSADGGDASEVTWRMDSAIPFFMFFLKSMMVSMISMDYDRGLKMLKELIETGSIASDVTIDGSTPVNPIRMVGMSAKTKLSDIEASMGTTIQRVQTELAAAGIDSQGQWLSLYDSMNMKTQEMEYTTGMVLAGGTNAPGKLVERSIPAFEAMKVTHTGKYSNLGNAFFAAYQNAHAAKRKVSRKLPAIEIYRNSPDDTAPEQLITEVYLPLK